MASGESTLSQLPDCCMIKKNQCTCLIEQIYTQNGSISCQQSDYLHFLLSVYIKQTFKNSNNSVTSFRYSLVRQPCRERQDIIHMFWGPLRSFHTNSDAINWHEHGPYLHHFLHHSHSVSQHMWHFKKFENHLNQPNLTRKKATKLQLNHLRRHNISPAKRMFMCSLFSVCGKLVFLTYFKYLWVYAR